MKGCGGIFVLPGRCHSGEKNPDELLRDDQETNLGKEEKSPRFQAVNEQENILHLTTKHKKTNEI